MDDITYSFHETNRERKALVPSAMKRTGGSKSRKCTLPHENLTPAQQKKLSGPVHTYNLSAPMGWETFKSMSKDLQEKYLFSLYDRFSVGSSTISEDLFSLGHDAVRMHCLRVGIRCPKRQGCLPAGVREVFRAWVIGDLNITEPDDLLTDTTEPVEPEKPVEPVIDDYVEPVSSVEPDTPTTRNTLTLATLRMVGSAEDVLATLRNFLTCDGEVELEVTINFKEENKQ